MRRFARELEVGDDVLWTDGRWYTVTAVEVEHQIIRLTFGEVAQLRLPTWTKVLVSA